MTAQSTVSAKIARPTHSKPVQRQRLFDLLDQAAAKPVTWIAAPGGSGKSTLVASYLSTRTLPSLWYQCDAGDADLATFFYYMGLAAKQAAPRHKKSLPLLTPEYFAGIATFTRRYFESLYGRLVPRAVTEATPGDFVIVLDNYQEVPLHAPFHEMIGTGVNCITAGIRLIILSRTTPPPTLARCQAGERIAMLDYDDLRFTLDEARQLIRDRLPALEQERVAQMHELTRGWAAGITLTLERRALGAGGTVPATDLDYDRVFDYFATEVFVRLEEKIRGFLLQTALLPILNAPLAERLTGIAGAGEILVTLNRHRLFTDRLAGSGENFQYHPLFRKFLVNRLKTVVPPAELAVLRQRVAHLLEQGGQREEAAQLYGEAGNHDDLARLVVRHGRELLAQGRCRLLADWLGRLPEAVIEANPWLLYWHGQCSFPVDPARTRNRLESALALFRRQRDISGIYLAWAGIVDSYAFGNEWKPLDACLADFDELQREHAAYPSAEIELIASSRMLLALTLRKPDQPRRVEEWLQRVTALLKEKPSLDIQLETIFSMSVYYLWKGDYERNAVLLERAAAEVRHRQPSPFTVIRIKMMKGIHCWVTADYPEALQTLSEGLEIAARHGVHVYDSLLWGFKAAAELAPGRLASAAVSLDRQMTALTGNENLLGRFFYHVNSAWYGLLTDKPALAATHLETVAAITEQMGTVYYRALWHIGMAQVAFALGDREEARRLAEAAHRIGLAMKSQVIEWYSLLILGWYQLQGGEETAGLLALHRGLSLGRRHGFVHLEFYQPAVIRELCARALAEEIEPEYVKRLIGTLALAPPLESGGTAAARLEAWPYPIKIYTLGRFEILRNDTPLPYAGKEQKKPLELLKALIALGGRNVPRERLTDLLWPDADGDLANKSFETTIGRLRKLLGNDGHLICRSRQLSLNPDTCWVDSLALWQLVEAIRTTPAGRAAALCKKAYGLYQGQFLPADTGLAWSAARRETLRNGLLRISLKAGRHHEEAGEWEQAADYYLKGIETDSLAEEFHRRLMICQRQLGNHSDAVKSYQRCRSLLRTELGIDPSPETTAVYSAIVHPA